MVKVKEVEVDIEEMFGHLLGRLTTEKVEVGIASPELLAAHNNIVSKEEQLEKDVRARMKEVAKMVQKEFEQRVQETKAEHESIWEQTYAEFNLDPTKKYSVHRKTGSVRMVVEKEI